MQNNVVLIDTVKIYPNPATEYIIIETTRFPTSAAFVDSQGKILGFIPIKAQRSKISIEGFEPGMYYLLITDRKYRFVIQ